MSTKKVSYIQLLKEAISEYDAKAMDYKGPITEPILTFDGEGELSTHRDASSILERYYFKESEVGPDNPVDVDDDEDATDPNNIVTGEEADGVDETMDDFEDEILEEDLELEDFDANDPEVNAGKGPFNVEEDLELEDYEPGDPDIVAKDKPLDDEKIDPTNEIISLENIVIEKLIREMEEEGNDTKATDVEKAGDDETAGTPGAAGEEAGKGASEDEIDKKINEDFELMEMELELEGDESEEESGKEGELDVDKDIEGGEKKVAESITPRRIKSHDLEEAFRIFKEQVEDEEEKEKEEGKEEGKEDEDEVKTEDFDLLEQELDLALEDEDL